MIESSDPVIYFQWVQQILIFDFEVHIALRGYPQSKFIVFSFEALAVRGQEQLPPEVNFIRIPLYQSRFVDFEEPGPLVAVHVKFGIVLENVPFQN